MQGEDVVVLREGENASQWQTAKVEALQTKQRGQLELYQVLFADGHHEVLTRHNLRRKSAGGDVQHAEEDEFKHVPSLATELQDVHVAECALGAEHCLLRTDGGQLWLFGDSQHGQCGRVNKFVPPEPLQFDDQVTAIAAGPWHSVFVASNCLYTFGATSQGQLGRDENGAQATRVHRFDGKVSSVAACEGITAISTVDGEIVVIGKQLGGIPVLNRTERVLSLAVCSDRTAVVLQPRTEHPFASVGKSVLCGAGSTISLQLQQSEWCTWSLGSGNAVEAQHSVGKFNLLCQHPSSQFVWASVDAHPNVLFLVGNTEQVCAAQRALSTEDIIRSPQMSLPVGDQYTSSLHTAGLLLASIAAVQQQQEPVRRVTLADKIQAVSPSSDAAPQVETDSVHRFGSIQNGWYLGGSQDAISFSVCAYACTQPVIDHLCRWNNECSSMQCCCLGVLASTLST